MRPLGVAWVQKIKEIIMDLNHLTASHRHKDNQFTFDMAAFERAQTRWDAQIAQIKALWSAARGLLSNAAQKIAHAVKLANPTLLR